MQEQQIIKKHKQAIQIIRNTARDVILPTNSLNFTHITKLVTENITQPIIDALIQLCPSLKVLYAFCN